MSCCDCSGNRGREDAAFPTNSQLTATADGRKRYQWPQPQPMAESATNGRIEPPRPIAAANSHTANAVRLGWPGRHLDRRRRAARFSRPTRCPGGSWLAGKNREDGAIPSRSRRCNRGRKPDKATAGRFMTSWFAMRIDDKRQREGSASRTNRKPEDLPGVGVGANAFSWKKSVAARASRVWDDQTEAAC